MGQSVTAFQRFTVLPTMSVTNTCPECGTPIPQDAPKGFCPACLVRAGAGGMLSEAVKESECTPVAIRDPMPDRAGFPRLFGGYELLEEIGRGGMGLVFFRKETRCRNRRSSPSTRAGDESAAKTG